MDTKIAARIGARIDVERTGVGVVVGLSGDDSRRGAVA
jgi:hypothetical protein